MPTTGATMMTTTQAMREAGSRCGRSSARSTKTTCSVPCRATKIQPGMCANMRHDHAKAPSLARWRFA